MEASEPLLPLEDHSSLTLHPEACGAHKQEKTLLETGALVPDIPYLCPQKVDIFNNCVFFGS